MCFKINNNKMLSTKVIAHRFNQMKANKYPRDILGSYIK